MHDPLLDDSTDAHATVGWFQRIAHKPAREIAADLTLFVLSVVVLYVVDLTIIRRGGPIAIRYMLDLFLYASHHAIAAVDMLS
jgi:hypothetical protein